MAESSRKPASDSYADAPAEVDDKLERRLAEVRRQSDAGDITLREAADLRVVALERHIARIGELRAEYFGTDSGD